MRTTTLARTSLMTRARQNHAVTSVMTESRFMPMASIAAPTSAILILIVTIFALSFHLATFLLTEMLVIMVMMIALMMPTMLDRAQHGQDMRTVSKQRN